MWFWTESVFTYRFGESSVQILYPGDSGLYSKTIVFEVFNMYSKYQTVFSIFWLDLWRNGHYFNEFSPNLMNVSNLHFCGIFNVFPHFPFYSLQSSPQFWHCLPTCQLVRMFILKRVLSVFFASPDTVVCLFFSIICYVEHDICILTICLYTEFSLFTNIRCQQIIQWAYEINNII